MTMSRFKFCGKSVSREEISMIREVIGNCGFNRTELALTVCEIMDWIRPNGKLKRVECLKFLDLLAERGLISIPKAEQRKRDSPKKCTKDKPEELPQLKGTLRDFGPVSLEVVERGASSKRWKKLIEEHHYLGYKQPYGAQIRYFIKVTRPKETIVGCLQFTSPAWRVEARDKFLGWDTQQRREHLQKIVQNSRFLILPTVSIKGLASHTLSIVKRTLPSDWEERFSIRPWWCETFVDTTRFKGTCYKAANWQYLGETKGRGRMDIEKKIKKSIKSIWLTPMNGSRTLRAWKRLICKH